LLLFTFVSRDKTETYVTIVENRTETKETKSKSDEKIRYREKTRTRTLTVVRKLINIIIN